MSSLTCDQVINAMKGDDKNTVSQANILIGPMSIKCWSVSRVKKNKNKK